MKVLILTLAVLLALMPMVLNVFFSIALSVAAELWVLSVILVLQMIVKSDNKVIVNVPKEAVKVNVLTTLGVSTAAEQNDNSEIEIINPGTINWQDVDVGESFLEGEKA